MKTLIKLLLFTIVLLLVGLGTISAVENVSDTSQTTDAQLKEITDSYVMEDTTTESSIQTTNQKTIEKNEIGKINNSVKEASTITITNKTYNQFFQQDEETGKIKSTDIIRDGDTLNLKGTFNDVDFAVDKSVTLTSLNNNALLYNCTVYIQTSGSNSTVSNLVINNSAEYTTGILINDSANLIIEDNVVEVSGLHSYALAANVNQSIIKSNYFETHKLTPETERTHSAVVLSDSYYNTVANNTVKSDGANCIYLSTYPAVGIRGGPSNNNNITGNNVTGAAVGWSYSIQVMGKNNLISENTVSGGYKGISASGSSTIIRNNDVNAVNQGIVAIDNSTVINNYIHVSNSSTGISAEGSNVELINNTIITLNGVGIDISTQGSNITISSNDITSNNYGIYSKGQYSHIIIDNNKIISEKEGVLFKKQSINKKMNHILVTNNNIKSNAEYAIDFNETGSNTVADVNVTVKQSNVLSSSRGIGLAVAYLPPSNANSTSGDDSNQVIRINSNNYTSYFENGVAKDNILQNATVYLNGTFNDLSFTFNKKVHIIGEKCTIKNGTITLTGDSHSSTITNVTINNKDTTAVNMHAIELLEVNNCNITNTKITNYAKYESLGIFLYSSNGNTIFNCNINTSGDYVNNGIFLYSSDSNIIQKNKVNINQSDVPAEYAESVMFNEKIGTIKEILLNHGIVLLYSSDNIISQNTVNTTSMFENYTLPTSECKNSIVGIDIYFDSHNNRVTNNNISVKSFGPYSYGMGVLGGQWGTSLTESNAIKNVYQNNIVNVQGGYFATGFIAGRNSVDTILDSNIFNIEANKNTSAHGDYALGITLENSTQSNITNNQLTIKGAAIYGMELFDSGNNLIFNNSLYATGTYPYAIAGYTSSNNNILNNSMTLKKVNYGSITTAQHTDLIPYGDDGIMFMTASKNNIIKFNRINTTANNTVKLTDQTSSNTVQENSLVAKSSVGDNSVNNMGTNNIVSNNFVYFVNATADPVYAYVGDTITLTAHINTTTTNYSNLSVTFKLGANTIGTSKVVNGKASLDYNVSTLWNPTTYQITVTVTGKNFQNATALSQAVFYKQADKINVNVAKVLATIGSNATLTANITTYAGGKIGSGQAEFYLDDTKIATVNLKLGVASCTYSIPADATSGVQTIRVVYLGTSDYANASGSNILGIQTVSEVTVANHTATLDSTANIKAKVVSGGKNVTSGSVKIFIDDDELTSAKISKGVVNTNVKIPTTFNKGNHMLKIVFDGNDTLSSAIGTSTITLNPMTPVFHYNNTGVNIGENVSLVLAIDNGANGSDLYTANDGKVSIKLNGQTLTDSSGKTIYGTMKNGLLTFTFTAPSQLAGSQNITFVYGGNDKFKSASKTYVDGLVIGKTDTIVTVNKIGSVKHNTNITITGNFTDIYGNSISNSNIKIILNGVKNYAKTDKNGTYVFVTTVTTPGTNNLTVGYSGNYKYNAYETNTTFNVGKQDVIVTYDKVKTVKAGTNVTITGLFKDNLGNVIANSNVKIFINGKKYYAKTDKNGRYNLSALVTKVGVNNASVGYSGNDRYNSYEKNFTFNVDKQDVIVTYNKISNVKKGKNVTITGKFTDNLGKAIANSNVKITINGIKYYAKTDQNGIYTFTNQMTTVGTYNVTIGYSGNTKYNAYETNTTFKVIS